MKLPLVVLDFKRRRVGRYLARVRTHLATIPDGFNGDDVEQLEQFRVQPDLFEQPPEAA